MNEARRARVARIRDNLRDGASTLARTALEVLAEHASTPADDAAALRRELLELADELAAARPNMAAIANLVTTWREAIAAHHGDLDALRVHARHEAELVREQADAATDATVAESLRRLGDARRVLTHSASSTVARVLAGLPAEGVEVIVTESRPGLEGRALAQKLAAAGLAVTYITDAQAGLFVGDADAVLVGADTLLGDGAVVNKAGTCLIALAAREAGVPLYVCAESFKCSDLAPADLVLEEQNPEELDPPAEPGIRARNFYFEITPARLITDWLSDAALASRFGR